MAERFYCATCCSRGFLPSVTGRGCTNCDGTQLGNPPKPAKVTKTYIQLNGRTVEIGHIIELLATLDYDEKTDWENNFLSDISATYEERRKSVNWLSDNQLDQLERLYVKYF